MVLAIILVFGTMIFIHELGHLLTMKMFGVTVERFSLGFGPFFGKKIGETEYGISLIPFGGYVKPADNNFSAKLSFWKNTVIILSGMFFNVLFASAILLFLASVFGVGLNLPYQFIQNSWLMQHLIVPLFAPFIFWLAGIPLSIYFLLTQSIPAGDAVAGPIMIGKIIADSYKAGLINLLFMTAFLNAAVAATNLLPIFPLDGGHIVIDFIKKKAKKLSFLIPFIQYAGLIIFALLVIFVMANDIIKAFLK